MNNKQFFQLINTKIKFNLRSEASKSYLSYAWWILEPILHMFVFFIVFGVFLNRGSDNFVAFLLCGLIPWLWFNRTIMNASSSIIGGKGLMNQVSIPKIFFPLVVIGQDFYKQLCVMCLLLLFLFFYGIPASLIWIWIIPLILTQLLLISAVTVLVAAFVPFVPDFKFIVSTGLQLLMFGSGIFYSYKDVLLPQHRDWFLLNPVANLIVSYREVLLENTAPNLSVLFYISAFSLLILGIMAYFIHKLEHVYPRIVIE